MPAENQKSAPNILVIMADQLTPFVLPAYGHALVKTPNIDALASEGLVFDNYYCNFPLCVPSRVGWMAGRLPNAIDCWDNASEMPAGIPTMAHYLRDAGYHTALCGKMHFVGPDQVHGFNERLTTDIYPANFAWTPDWIAGERYRPTGINMSAVVDAGTCVRSLQMDYDEEVEHSGVQKIHDLARFNANQPFFLTVSFTHPHSPYIIPQRYWDMYDHDEIDMPRVPPIALDDQDTMSRWLHYAHGGDLHDVTDAHVRNARHAYYGMTSYIDDKVGSLLQALKDTGMDDNTLIIFTSDHGEMLGERGMWYKQSFYESSCRVPLIVHYPKGFGAGRVQQNCSHVDILPTLMDIATAGQPPEYVSPLEGHSMVGLMQGDTAAWDNTVIAEYTGEGVCSPCRMVRRDNYKYIYTHGHPALLYDLESDPQELHNLSGQAEYQDLERLLHQTLIDGWDPAQVNEDILQSQKERQLIQRTTQGDPSWAYDVGFDKDARYVRNAGAVQTKARARYPFIEPTPFKR